MPLTKKITLFIIVTIVLFTCLSGCSLDDIFSGGASFSLSSERITDDDGFPVISFYYTCSDTVTVKITGPNSIMIDSDFFLTQTNYNYENNPTVINLGAYRETISSGNYKLKVYDEDNKAIFTKSFSISNEDVKINSCEQKWWNKEDATMLIGLTMTVENNGNAPVYPYQVNIEIDSESITGYVIPEVILPGESESIDCSIYKNEAPIGEALTIKLLDSNSNILDTNSYSIDTSSNVATRSFTDGVESKLTVPYPDFLYNYYSNLDRIIHEDYSVYVFNQFDDAYIDIFTDRLISTLPFGEFYYNSKSDVEKIEIVASFVQNLEYKKDSDSDDSIEYPNFPIETIFTGSYGCDCEDKAILTATLLDNLGFNVALFRLPNHMAIGIQLSESAVPGDDYYIDNYYYLETTTPNNDVGYIPNKYRSPSSNLTVYPISTRPLLLHSWSGGTLTHYTNTGMGDFVKLTAIIENQGRSTANNFKIKAVFTSSNNIVQKSEEVTITSLEPGMKKKVVLDLKYPKNILTFFKTRIYLDGIIADEKESELSFP